jgi:hypothetical protein
MANPSGSSDFFSQRGVIHAERARHDIRAFFIFFLCGAVVWIFVLSPASFLNGGSFLTTLGTLGMFSAAGMISGGVLGFLFGIPRVLASSAAAAAQSSAPSGVQPNTYLEQISDWLTKVLVGVGLTQIGSIYTAMGTLSASLTNLFTGKPSDGPITVVTLVTFLLSGFLWAYFESRTSLLLLFNDVSDADADTAVAAAAGAVAGAATGQDAGATAGAITGAITGAQAGAAAAQTPGSGREEPPNTPEEEGPN